MYSNAFYIRNPQYLEKFPNDKSNIMNSLYNIGLYNIMPLQLVKAEKTMGGIDAFQNKLSELYQGNLYRPIAYKDFLYVTNLKEEDLILE